MMERTIEEIRQKLEEVDAIRVSEPGNLSDYTRGELAGIQQALYWACGEGADPLWCALGGEQLAAIAKVAELTLGGYG